MRAIAVVSGKGGVGKSTTAINLGASLSNLGKEVIVVDANISTPDIGLSLGAPIVPIALQHILSGEHEPASAVYLHNSGTKILPSSLSFNQPFELSNLPQAISKLKDLADLVVIDSAAGIGEDVIASISSADECLIVTNPEMPALSSALKTIRLAEELGKEVLGVVITKSRGKGKGDLSNKNVASFLGYPVIGTIPEDENVRAALQEKEPLINAYPRSKASKGYNQLAKSIIEKNASLTSIGKIKNFFSDLMGSD